MVALGAAHVLAVVIRRSNMNIFSIGFLIMATYCHFITGAIIFINVKKHVILFSSLILLLSGLISGYVVFTSLYSLLIILMAVVIHWFSKNKIIKGVKNMGVMYVNLSALPTIVYLAKWIGS